MSRCQHIEITAEMTGRRLDHVLAGLFPEHTRSNLQQLIGVGAVRVNEGIVKKRHTVRAGECIRIDWPEEPTVVHGDPSVQLSILHEDDAILVINKPPGMVVHPGAGTGSATLIHGLLAYDPARYRAMLDASVRPGIVHRLDKDTSGVIVVAKTPEVKAALTDQFRDRTVAKLYFALVGGIPDVPSGRVQSLIGRHPVRRQRMAVVARNGKEGITDYWLAAAGNGASLLRVRPLTGRTHQIRVHLHHLGHAVIGDKVYRSGHPAVQGVQRQMLHAGRLELAHPATGARASFRAPLPPDFLAAVHACGIDGAAAAKSVADC